MHRAGASALSQLLRGDPPGPDEREIPCSRGHKARYREMHARRVLTSCGRGGIAARMVSVSALP